MKKDKDFFIQAHITAEYLGRSLDIEPSKEFYQYYILVYAGPTIYQENRIAENKYRSYLHLKFH